MESKKLLNLSKMIQEVLMPGIKKDFPGGQYCIVNKDEMVCGYVGYKQYEPLIENDGTEIYDVASLTKVVSTTTLVFHLIEQNKLSLDTKVSDILERFKHPDVSIYDLLIHSSGLPSDVPRSNTMKEKEDVLKVIYGADIIYEKYEKVIYSDMGYILLGEIIEKLSGKPIDELAREVIFKPLHMKDSSYKPNKERCAPTEYRDDNVYKGLLQGNVHDEKSFAMNGLSGHAGLFSTAKDIGLFIQSILNQRFVLSQETMDEIFKSRIIKEGRWGMSNRSLGWDKPVKDIDKVIMHTGFTGCNMWIDLNLDLGFVLLTNGVHPKREMNNIFPFRAEIRKRILELF